MPAFEALAAADVAALRDARAGHRLVFGAGDRADELNTLAPNIFTGGGGAPDTSAYGQFASLVLGSVVRVPVIGGPASDKVLGRHRCSDLALHRWWTTCIAILSRMDDPQRQAFWEPKQRGPFLSSLAKLRGTATRAELVAFELVDADLQRISMDNTLDVLNFMGLEVWYKSIKYEPSLGGREAAEPGVRFVSTAAPVSVTGAKRQPSDTDPHRHCLRSHMCPQPHGWMVRPHSLTRSLTASAQPHG